MVEAVVRTTGDTRLFYGRGHVILNWSGGDPDDLRYTDPATGAYPGWVGHGRVPRGRWVRVRWVVEERQAILYVDGRERCRIAGAYKGLTGRVGIGPWRKCELTVAALTAGPLPSGGEAAGDPDAVFAGAWRGRWQGGGPCDYAFAGGRFTSSGSASAAFRVDGGGAVTIDHQFAQPGITNFGRFMPDGAGRLLLESWAAADEFRAGVPPRDTGIAVRREAK